MLSIQGNTGNANFSGTVTAPTFIGNSTANGVNNLDLTAGTGRSIVFFNENTLALINNSGFYPFATNSRSLGLAANYWTNVYTQAVTCSGNVTATTFSGNHAGGSVSVGNNPIFLSDGNKGIVYSTVTNFTNVDGPVIYGWTGGQLATMNSTNVSPQYSSLTSVLRWNTGAVNITGTLAVSGAINSSSEVQSTSQNAFRMVQGSYGAFWRNDGTNVFLMSTAVNNPYGDWNALRSFIYNMSSGNVTLVESAGNVGVGTSSPSQKLHVVGSILCSGTVTAPTFSGVLNNGNSLSTSGWYFDTNSKPRLLFNSLGKTSFGSADSVYDFRNAGDGQGQGVISCGQMGIGLGATLPSDRLHVSGNILCSGTVTAAGITCTSINTQNNDISVGSGTMYANWFRSTGTSGWLNNTHQGGWYMNEGTTVKVFNDKHIYTGGNVTAADVFTTSDARLKTDIEILRDPLNKIDELNGVYFKWTSDYVDYGKEGKEGKEETNENLPDREKEKKKRHIGFIAQDVQKVLPEVVNEDADGYLSVSYANVVALLVEGMKELRRENKMMKEENKIMMNT